MLRRSDIYRRTDQRGCSIDGLAKIVIRQNLESLAAAEDRYDALRRCHEYLSAPPHRRSELGARRKRGRREFPKVLQTIVFRLIDKTVLVGVDHSEELLDSEMRSGHVIRH